MSSSTGSVEEKIRMLPPDLREEAIHFIEELAKRKKQPRKKKFRLGWAGGLSHIDKSITSVELQHEASKWRG
ncbi:MAG: DUF2281 domain-containing protein [Methanoregula sp.]|jgi:hypothetical protein|uniref:DUF2281 domain-containing protein n=1 Tax=Methanoregula sp. TaxID=2052170 RepID=UPI003D131B14